MNQFKRLRIDRIAALVCWLLMPVYVYHVFRLTLLGRPIRDSRTLLVPFWEFRNFIRTERQRYWMEQIMGNLAMLFPFGLMLPIMLKWFRTPVRTGVAAFGFSLFIESVQYVTGRGIFEIDDLMHNTLGALVGFFVYMFAMRLLIEYRRAYQSNEWDI